MLLIEEDKLFLKRIFYGCILFGIISLIILITIPFFLKRQTSFLYFYIYYILWFILFVYMAHGIKKRHKELKFITYLSPILLIIAMICDGFAHAFHLYDDANHFFNPPRIDILSHFLSGMAIFTISVLILSFFNLRHRIENIAFILANILLFLWELYEELGDVFILLLSLDVDLNPFFWNSVQDLIMNCIGTICIYLLLRKYLIRSFPIIQFIQ